MCNPGSLGILSDWNQSLRRCSNFAIYDQHWPTSLAKRAANERPRHSKPLVVPSTPEWWMSGAKNINTFIPHPERNAYESGSIIESQLPKQSAAQTMPAPLEYLFLRYVEVFQTGCVLDGTASWQGWHHWEMTEMSWTNINRMQSAAPCCQLLSWLV